MKEPRRLRLESSNDLERRLLGAGRARAPREARQRALVAATAALGTTMAATGAAAATSGAAASGGAAGGGATAGSAAASTIAKTGSVAMLKWLSVVGLAGIGAATAAVSVQHAHPVSETTATTVEATDGVRVAPPSKAPRRAGPASEDLPSEEAPSANANAALSGEVATPSPPSPPPSPLAAPSHPAAATTPAAISPSAASPSASSGSTLPAELAMLDQARSAMTAGEPARALSLLDAYTERFPHASLAAEATVLRIEALLKAGDPAAAHRTADAFLAANPRSPYAERIRTLLGESNP